MLESQFDRTQGESRRAVGFGPAGSEQGLIVYFLSAQGVAVFGQMNANLMSSARLQSTFNEGIIPDLFNGVDVRHGALANLGQGGASAPAVAAIADQAAFDPLRFDLAMHHGQLAATDRMEAKLSAQVLFGLGRPGKDHQAAGFAVQTMDGPNRAAAGFGPSTFSFGNQAGENFRKGGLNLPTARWLTFVGVTGRGHARRFFDHDQVLVEIADADVLIADGPGGRGIEHFHHVGQFKPITGIGAEVSVDRDLPGLKQLPNGRPRLARQPFA